MNVCLGLESSLQANYWDLSDLNTGDTRTSGSVLILTLSCIIYEAHLTLLLL